jgi:hypothetical protein
MVGVTRRGSSEEEGRAGDLSEIGLRAVLPRENGQSGDCGEHSVRSDRAVSERVRRQPRPCRGGPPRHCAARRRCLTIYDGRGTRSVTRSRDAQRRSRRRRQVAMTHLPVQAADTWRSCDSAAPLPSMHDDGHERGHHRESGDDAGGDSGTVFGRGWLSPRTRTPAHAAAGAPARMRACCAAAARPCALSPSAR